MPKRESLRRVLELSKQEYENKNKKSTDETDESDNDDISDEETDSKGNFSDQIWNTEWKSMPITSSVILTFYNLPIQAVLPPFLEFSKFL